MTPDARVLNVILLHEVDDEEVEANPEQADDNKLTVEQSTQLDDVLQEWAVVLSADPDRMSIVNHAINTGSVSPFTVAPYQVPSDWREQLKEAVGILLQAGIISPSWSPWPSPVLPVKKKDGTIRICVDFRKLNTVTVPDPYDMPSVDDVIDQLGEVKFLSKLDLAKSFYQVPMAIEDIEKTVFTTPFGKYEFVTMPFGLRNTPATFQRLMDVVLVDMQEFACTYMDDMIIYSNTWDEHMAHTNTVLERFGDIRANIQAYKM